MITCRPRSSADAAYAKSLSGVRWADTTSVSNGTASDSRVSAAWRIVSQSEREPMMIPTTGTSLTVSSLLRSGLLHEERRDRAGGLAQVGVLLVALGDPLEDLDRVALRRAVLQAHHRETPDCGVRVARREFVQQRSERVHVAGMGSREALERDERGASRGGALVLEAAAEQLEFLAEAELGDRAVRLGTDAVVRVARTRLDLLVPLGAEGRKCLLVACLCEGVRLGSRLGERHSSSERERGPGPV